MKTGRAVRQWLSSAMRSGSDFFASDPAPIGRAIDLDGTPYTIVGVLPPAFDAPFSSELWVPMQVSRYSPGHPFRARSGAEGGGFEWTDVHHQAGGASRRSGKGAKALAVGAGRGRDGAGRDASPRGRPGGAVVPSAAEHRPGLSSRR